MEDVNRIDAMHKRCALYREAGADGVWIVGPERPVQFFGEGRRERPDFVPDVPGRVQFEGHTDP
ncbi:hypothetical protein [Salinibacter grassmerensis]|uniref:hypothetical protein n=1 Tax=Salinibacter grassmerensis TaxID=3040353 RepID=UPI0021E8934A|nr:hypothetical protein [Salinibacter grassmerensis]